MEPDTFSDSPREIVSIEFGSKSALSGAVLDIPRLAGKPCLCYQRKVRRGLLLFACPDKLGNGREPGLLCLILIHSHHDIVEESVDERIACNGEGAGVKGR
jgi:hypothetical protein